MLSQKYTWKQSLQNDGHFVSASVFSLSLMSNVGEALIVWYLKIEFDVPFVFSYSVTRETICNRL